MVFAQSSFWVAEGEARRAAAKEVAERAVLALLAVICIQAPILCWSCAEKLQFAAAPGRRKGTEDFIVEVCSSLGGLAR